MPNRRNLLLCVLLLATTTMPKYLLASAIRLADDSDPDWSALSPTSSDDFPGDTDDSGFNSYWPAYPPDQWEEVRPSAPKSSQASSPLNMPAAPALSPYSLTAPSYEYLPPESAPSYEYLPPESAPKHGPQAWTPSAPNPPKIDSYDPLVFNVNDFGAKGNGFANDTLAFINTWKMACRKKRQGQRPVTMLVPAGRVYLVYPVSFKGPCQTNFTLRILGRIIAPSNPLIWKEYDSRLWIMISKVTNFLLAGPGVIDGQGQGWWAQSCKRSSHTPCRRAPTALTFRRSRNVDVWQMTFTNSQQMHLDFSTCSDVRLDNINILSPESSPNTDGIHIERSQGITITHSSIATGDDCVSIGPGSTSIVVQDSVCGPGHGISIGSLGKKNTFDKVSNVTVENVILRNTMNGLRIKTWEGGRGIAHDVVFQHISMHEVKNPIVIDQFYCDSEHSGTCKPKMKSGASNGVAVSNVVYSHIVGTSATQVAVKFRCSRPSPCHKISLQDVALLYKNQQASSLCENAYGTAESYVVPPACLMSENQDSGEQNQNRSRDQR